MVKNMKKKKQFVSNRATIHELKYSKHRQFVVKFWYFFPKKLSKSRGNPVSPLTNRFNVCRFIYEFFCPITIYHEKERGYANKHP